MENIRYKVKEDLLIIKIDMSAKGKPSSTGKSTILAQTARFEKIDGTDLSLQLNLIKVKSKKEKKEK